MRFLFILLLSFPLSLLAQFETPYQSTLSNAPMSEPDWVTEMYKSDADPQKVIDLYQAYYKTNTFVKNGNTQYYKRWLRSISREVQSSPTLDRRYREAQSQASTRLESWSTIGPIDWDHDAAARSYAPGAAHVYTVEQAKSNPDVVYAGTATAGIWKSTDRGNEWLPLTYDINSATTTALAIDHQNENIVYAELYNNVYKSINGGADWLPTGNATFQGLSMNVTDILMDPTDVNKLYAATSIGLYRTTDAGISWSEVLDENVQEIEIHPTDHDTIYASIVDGDETEFYRSTDDGLTFSLIGHSNAADHSLQDHPTYTLMFMISNTMLIVATYGCWVMVVYFYLMIMVIILFVGSTALQVQIFGDLVKDFGMEMSCSVVPTIMVRCSKRKTYMTMDGSVQTEVMA